MSVVGDVLSYFRRMFVVTSPSAASSVRVPSGESVDEGDVLALSSAWACVRLLSGIISSLPLAPYRETSTGHKEVARDHALYRLLHRAPNAEQTVVDFWEGGVASLELKGNLLALKQRSVTGQIIGLAPMAWDWTRVCRRNDDGPLVYEYRGKEYGPEDVLHIRGFGGAPEGGISTIAQCAQSFGHAKALNRASGRIFANGIRPSGILSTPESLTEEQHILLKDTLQQDYAGAVNTGRPLVLDRGLKWEALSINPDDAQLLESRSFSVEEVCSIFGVPPHMIGHTEKNTSWGTGIEQQTLAFQRFTLRSRLKRIETALEQQLLSPEDIAAGVSIEFNLEGLLRGDSKARAEFYQAALGDTQKPGWMVRNEIRKMEGLPAIEGWDDPVPMLTQTMDEQN